MLEMRVYALWGPKTPLEGGFHQWRSDGGKQKQEKKLTCVTYFYYTFLKNIAMGKL